MEHAPSHLAGELFDVFRGQIDDTQPRLTSATDRHDCRTRADGCRVGPSLKSRRRLRLNTSISVALISGNPSREAIGGTS
jgi:hypothetical protein